MVEIETYRYCYKCFGTIEGINAAGMPLYLCTKCYTFYSVKEMCNICCQDTIYLDIRDGAILGSTFLCGNVYCPQYRLIDEHIIEFNNISIDVKSFSVRSISQRKFYKLEFCNKAKEFILEIYEILTLNI